LTFVTCASIPRTWGSRTVALRSGGGSLLAGWNDSSLVHDQGSPGQRPGSDQAFRAAMRQRSARSEPLIRATLAEFVNQVGYWSHFNAQAGLSAWPLPELANPQSFAEYGHRRGIIHRQPEFGDIYLHWDGIAEAYTRMAIVLDVQSIDDVVCHTVMVPRLDGSGCDHVTRVMTDTDRFLRWADLDLRHFIADAVAAGDANERSRSSHARPHECPTRRTHAPG
jgi:hypothetical protein